MGSGTFDRSEAAARLGRVHFDVVVIGGGITGAGVALDAASRGLRTALLERDDFASGTSSRSSKLVHGGLRYLQQGDVRLVYEALAERQRLRRNAPHLVRVMPFLLPIFSRDGLFSRKVAWALGKAMWMYDLTGGARIGKLHRRISAGEALAYMPTLPSERLAGAYLYYDAATDDARLTLAVARTAALDFGAVVLNRAEVVELPAEADGRIRSVVAELDGERVQVQASCVVNATGVWADHTRALGPTGTESTIRPAKGVHVALPWEKVRNEIAVVLPVPGDRRSVFVVPWGDQTYVGTTDTDYDGSLEEPLCTQDDIAYLLGALNASLREPLGRADVTGTWAGLRPLVDAGSEGRTADLSRRHRVEVGADGMITVTGGKLTTYREMAEDTVDTVLRELGAEVRSRTLRRSPTKKLRLRGATGYEELREAGSPTAVLDDAAVTHLADRYGAEARVLLAMVEADPTLAVELAPGHPYLRAEALYAARYEMAGTLDDVLTRRIPLRQRDAAACTAAAADVAALIAPELGWSPEETSEQVRELERSVAAEREAASLPGAASETAAP